VVRTYQPAGGASAIGLDPGLIRTCDWPLRGGECDPASQAFRGRDAKYAKGGADHDRPANLKPNIYYKAQDFPLGAHRAPGCRDASRADHHLSGAAGNEGEPIGPGVNARPGPTERSSAPESAARAGFSFDEPDPGMAEDAACDC